MDEVLQDAVDPGRGSGSGSGVFHGRSWEMGYGRSRKKSRRSKGATGVSISFGWKQGEAGEATHGGGLR